jgi:hypothetical protein
LLKMRPVRNRDASDEFCATQVNIGHHRNPVKKLHV